MVNIKSVAAEIRRGKKKKERKKQDENILVCHILHRATIINVSTAEKGHADNVTSSVVKSG